MPKRSRSGRLLAPPEPQAAAVATVERPGAGPAPPALARSHQPATLASTAATRVLERFYVRLVTFESYLCGILPIHAALHVAWCFAPQRGESSAQAQTRERLRASIVGLTAEEVAELEAGPLPQFCDWTPPDPRELEGVRMLEVVAQAQRRLLLKSSLRGTAVGSYRAIGNIITSGYRSASERSPLAPTTGGITNFQPNSNVTAICTGVEWLSLLHGLGAGVFIHVLANASLFIPVAGSLDCYMQQLGVPISEGREHGLAPRPKNRQVTREPVRAPEVQTKRKRRLRRRKSAKTSTADVEPPSSIASLPNALPSVDLAKGPLPRLQLPHRAFSRVQSAPSFGELPRPALKAASGLANGALRESESAKDAASRAVRKPTEITLVRARIFYARPVRSKRRSIVLGFPAAHVFERTAKPDALKRTLRRTVAAAQGTGKSKRWAKLTEEDRKLRVGHVLKYIWPRQHGLHNVFTSNPDWRVTTQPFEDYTNREDGIFALKHCNAPKRLRNARHLVSVMLRKYDKLDVVRLLGIICPSRLPRRRLTTSERAQIAEDMAETTHAASQACLDAPAAPIQSQSVILTQAPQQLASPAGTLARGAARAIEARMEKGRREKPRFTLYAVPAGQVSRFVQMVLKSILPRDLIGSDHNWRVLLRNADTFVRARRYETLNLHQLLDGMRPNDCTWARAPGALAAAQRPTAQESLKRRVLLAELLYFIFDGLLIPLVRTTFYATDAVAFRNRVLYFRHDDWAAVSAPLLDKLKRTTFERISRSEAMDIVSERQLGYSHIRLMPKETGVRPIVNLRRRFVKALSASKPAQPTTALLAAVEGGKGTEAAPVPAQPALAPPPPARLAQSINSVLQNTFQVLTSEKRAQPELLGGSVFGPNDIYTRLKDLKHTFAALGADGRLPKLYMVKVDVVAAFDTIDQGKLLEIIRRILSQEDAYVVQRYTQVSSASGKVKKSYMRRACAEADQKSFPDLVAELAGALRHVVFADSVVYAYEKRERLLALLEQHVNENLVKIGPHFYRQRVGIPQGSSLSTILCCFYLAELERTKLAFVRDRGCALLRYVDDTLFVTTSKSRARRFFDVMNEGHPEFGCFIAPEKSLVNFDLPNSRSPGEFVARIHGREFPWCAFVLDPKTLSVRAEFERYSGLYIGDTLTVEAGKTPGVTLLNKMAMSIKSRAHIIFMDTALNGEAVVHHNVYQAFLLTAVKLLAYLKALRQPPSERARTCLFIIQQIVTFSHSIIRARADAARSLHAGASCGLRLHHVRWLGLHAFRAVLRTREAQYKSSLVWLDSEISAKRFSSARMWLQTRAARSFAASAQTLSTLVY